MQVTAQQAAKLWSKRDNIYADVIAEINGANVTTHKKLPASELTEETLLELRDSYDTDTIILKAYNKNGNAYIFENEVTVNLSGKPANSRSMSGSMSGFEEEEDYSVSTSQSPAPFSSPVASIPASNANLALFQYIAQTKEQEVNDLRKRNETLTRDMERMKIKLADVEFELKIKDKEHELALDKKDSEKSNSLSGFIEQASKPEILQHLPALIGALKGGHQMGALPEADPFAGLDPEHANALKGLNSYLKTNAEMSAKTYAIVDAGARIPGFMDKCIRLSQKQSQSNE